MPRRYAVYFTGETPAKRLGTVTAPDRQAAIKKAIELYDISETSKLRLDVLSARRPKLKAVKGQDGL